MKSEKLKVNIALKETTLETIADDHAHNLARLRIWHDGRVYEIRQYVYGKANWSVQVYGDHNPPHFHVKSPDTDASLTISDCRILKGNIDSDTHKKIKYWHERLGGQGKIIEYWNKHNPDNKIVE